MTHPEAVAEFAWPDANKIKTIPWLSLGHITFILRRADLLNFGSGDYYRIVKRHFQYRTAEQHAINVIAVGENITKYLEDFDDRTRHDDKRGNTLVK